MKHILLCTIPCRLNDNYYQSDLSNAISLGKRVQACNPEKKILIRAISQTGLSVGLRSNEAAFYLLKNMAKDEVISVLNKGEFLGLFEVDDEDIQTLPAVANLPARIQITLRSQVSQIIYGTNGEEPVVKEGQNFGFDW